MTAAAPDIAIHEPSVHLEDILPPSRRAVLGRYRALGRTAGFRLASLILRVLHRAKLLRPETKTYYVFSTEPLIIYLGNVMRHVFEIAELLKDRRVCFIKNSYHTFERQDRRERLRQEVLLFKRVFRQHDLRFICPTETEHALFLEAGILPSYFINKNAFVDEALFRIVPEEEKRFDAIHNGQLAPYKRHEFAARVDNLGVLTYRRTNSQTNDEYARQIDALLPHATWLSRPDHTIPPRDVPSLLNQARVGLCLSKEEGPMAASMEYMLCGLPIVSTRSLGGRDVFFDPEYVRIVDDDPDAVADGVREMIARDIDPEYIRRKTLDKIHLHRQKFVALIQEVYERHGVHRRFEDEFPQLFVNKLRVNAAFPASLFEHVRSGMPVAWCREAVRHRTC